VNSMQRFTDRLRGARVDRPPNFNILMTFAAHFIDKPLSEYYLDYRVLVEANIAVVEAFDLDIVQAISDPYREAADLGADVQFPHDDLPLCRQPLISEPADLRPLKAPQGGAGRRMSDRLEAVRTFRERVGGDIPIMGWVEGALAEAADLRGVVPLLYDLKDRPGWVEELLEFCVEVEIAFARAQVAAGADIIGLGDAVASQISLQMYERFALPYERRVFDAVREMGARTRLHICGDTSHLLPLMPSSGAGIIDIDWMVDLAAATEAFGDGAVVCGNFDPVAIMLQGTPAAVRDATFACLTSGGERCISAAGCEIPDATPHENLRAQAQALKEFGIPRVS
jgi:MtaA/CmuA family methyltransferase